MPKRRNLDNNEKKRKKKRKKERNVNDIWKGGKDISVARVLGTASSCRGEQATATHLIDLVHCLVNTRLV